MRHVTPYTETQREPNLGILSTPTGYADAMTKLPMSVDEYLRTSFDGADREYLDGDVVERNMGELPHGRVQKKLVMLLAAFESQLNMEVIPELRVQVTPTRFRIPDVSVWLSDIDIGTRIPTVPPFLAIEILSAEDRFTRMEVKIREYLAFGVKWVWLIDPDERTAFVFSPANPAGRQVEDLLRTEDPTIEIRLVDAFAQLPRSDASAAAS